MNPLTNPFVRREARRPATWIRKRRMPRATILMYHGVGTAEVDPWSLFVTPETFANHMAVVRQIGRPMTLTELGQAHRDGSVPENAVVVTFDDGYLNNLTNAAPILEQFEVPATVFAICQPIAEQREFWWDELGALLLRPGRLPDELSILGEDPPLRVDTARDYTESDYRADHGYREGIDQPSERIRLYNRVWELLMPMTHSARNEVLTALGRQLDRSLPSRSEYVPLTPAQVLELDQTIVDVGAHTMTHPLLPRLNPEDQLAEILQSKQTLETWLGRSVTTFSYPFGGRDRVSVGAAREAGIEVACTTVQETVSDFNHTLELPRFDVKNWSGEEFRARATRWFRYL